MNDLHLPYAFRWFERMFQPINKETFPKYLVAVILPSAWLYMPWPSAWLFFLGAHRLWEAIIPLLLSLACALLLIRVLGLMAFIFIGSRPYSPNIETVEAFREAVKKHYPAYQDRDISDVIRKHILEIRDKFEASGNFILAARILCEVDGAAKAMRNQYERRKGQEPPPSMPLPPTDIGPQPPDRGRGGK